LHPSKIACPLKRSSVAIIDSCFQLADGTEVAIKELVLGSDESAVVDQFRLFQHEVYMMSRINHPMLVRMYGIVLQPRLRLVMEYCPLPDLAQLLYDKAKKQRLTFIQKLTVGFNVASALAYLHSQQPPIVHRDVRSPNVFVVSLDPGAEVMAKVVMQRFRHCDFGCFFSVVIFYSFRLLSLFFCCCCFRSSKSLIYSLALSLSC
jgi:serine/threonine protein kinase